MSLSVDIATYIAANSSLTLDTDLFVADEPVDSPDTCVIIISSPGSYDTESGLEKRAIQALAKAKTFVDAETEANIVFDLLKNKPGFDSIDNIFYSDVLSAPYPVDRDDRSRYVFTMNFLISKVTP